MLGCVKVLRALLTNNLTLGAGTEPLAQLARTLFGVVRVKDALLGCIVGRQRAEVEPGTLEHAVVGGSKRLDRVKRYVTRLTGCVLASAVSGHMTETARKIVVTGFREDVRVKRCLGLMGGEDQPWRVYQTEDRLRQRRGAVAPHHAAHTKRYSAHN